MTVVGCVVAKPYFASPELSGQVLHSSDAIRSWNMVVCKLRIMGKSHDTKRNKTGLPSKLFKIFHILLQVYYFAAVIFIALVSEPRCRN